jgi:hypothetical protein
MLRLWWIIIPCICGNSQSNIWLISCIRLVRESLTVLLAIEQCSFRFTCMISRLNMAKLKSTKSQLLNHPTLEFLPSALYDGKGYDCYSTSRFSAILRFFDELHSDTLHKLSKDSYCFIALALVDTAAVQVPNWLNPNNFSKRMEIDLWTSRMTSSRFFDSKYLRHIAILITVPCR